MRYISNHTSAVKFILAREEFEGNSMSGKTAPRYYTGRLPKGWADLFTHNIPVIDYVVYSWATPIAWHTPSGWIYPAVNYSGYSSRHQWYAFRAIIAEGGAGLAHLTGDRYYSAFELMRAYITFRDTGKAPAMETARRETSVTIRGLKNYDYLQSEDGIWRRIVDVEKVNGVNGTKYWRATLKLSDGAHETRYIGDHTERVWRLR